METADTSPLTYLTFNTTQVPVHFLPLFVADAWVTPQHIIRINSALDPQKPLVVGSPKSSLPVWFVRIGLFHVVC
jgi:hypothetical protein